MKQRIFTKVNAPAILDQKQLRVEELKRNLKYKVSEMIEKQSGMLSEVVGSKVSGFSLWGQKDDTVYSGFPIKYFEPMSYLERIAEWFTNFPIYLDYD